LVDVNDNGSLADPEDDLGPADASSRITYDFGGGAGPQTYVVGTSANYGLLLIDVDIALLVAGPNPPPFWV
jgi:hypothetical protein